VSAIPKARDLSLAFGEDGGKIEVAKKRISEQEKSNG